MNTDAEKEFDRQEEEYRKRTEEMTLSPSALEIFKVLDDKMNGLSFRDMEKLAKAIANGHINGAMHRTIQQSTIRFFMATIEEMAKLDENRTDARNASSRLISMQMVEGFKKVRSEYDSEIHGRPINDACNPSQYLPYV